MLKVVMISSEWRGIESQSYFRKVIDIVSKHWKPMLILAPCPGKKGLVKIKEGVWYYCFPSFRNYLLFALSRHKIKSKLLVAQDPFWYGVMALLLKHSYSKVIVELHSQYFFNKKWLKYRLRNMIYHMIGRKILQKADYIRAVYYDKKLFNKYKNKVLYVPSNYTDTHIFKPKSLNKEYDVIYVGRLHPQKNIEYLVNILKKLKERGYKCAVIGKGNQKYNIMIKKTGCKYLEYVKNLASFYNKSKLLIIVSHDEGGPRVAYEAIASGCLVVTTPTGKIKEDLKKYPECGELLTGEDILKDIIIISRVLQEHNKRWYECYKKIKKELNFDKQVRHYGKVYEDLID